MKFRNNDYKTVYEYDKEEKKYILHLQLDNYQTVYNDWDYSPFTNRDLDEDLSDYLLECSYEIPIKYDLLIKFFITNQTENEIREERSIIGIKNFFKYQMRKLNNKRILMLKNTATFFLIGVVLLVTSLYISKLSDNITVYTVISQGLLIGGWVMIWEMFSTLFFQIKDINFSYKHFKRLFESTIDYNYIQKKEKEIKKEVL